MRTLVHFLTAGLLAATGAVSAQTCQVSGGMTYCPPATSQKTPGGSQPQVGGTTPLNYPTGLGAQQSNRAQPTQHGETTQRKWLLPQSTPHPATQRQGASQARPQLGRYDTGASTLSSANANSYGNGVTAQSPGNSANDSTGKACQQAGTMTNCNLKPIVK
jgi:hypothetical protein